MLVALRVNQFITGIFPRKVCDECVRSELKLRHVTQATPSTVALGTTSDFRREVAQWALCGNTRMTTCATAARTVALADT